MKRVKEVTQELRVYQDQREEMEAMVVMETTVYLEKMHSSMISQEDNSKENLEEMD